MRIGVLGGSFNPPHVGHLIAASDACEKLRLDLLLIIPASANPLKGRDASDISSHHRLEMVRLAFGRDPRFQVSSMEIERGGLSYTVDTLEGLAVSYPGAELTLLAGTDAFRTFHKWKQPDRIRELARLAVLFRGDTDAALLPPGVDVVATRRVDVSASEIRARIAGGLSIRGFVAESVERYISAAELYRVPAAR